MMQSLNFIDHLCDICNELTKYENDLQRIYLYNKLLEINKKLPCNVYLPFLKESTRNYIICHIPLEGIKIFRTKTRCPIMLTFEMIRIDEVNKANENEDFSFERSSSSTGAKNKNRRLILLNQKINSSYDNNLFYSTDYDLSKPLMINNSTEMEDNTNKKPLKKIKTKNKNKRWYASSNIKLFPFRSKTKFDALNDLEDKDIEEDDKFTVFVSNFLKNSVKANNSLDKS